MQDNTDMNSTNKTRELEMLIAAVDQNVTTLAAAMNVNCRAIIVNQCHEFAYSSYVYKGNDIQCFHCDERGVGKSRNIGILHSQGDILLFADEDIKYREGYDRDVLAAFNEHPEADMLLFNIRQSEGRETYYNTSYDRVRWYNCGRYPAYSIAVRRDRLLESGVMFSQLFGGGAKYSNGEDSLFLMDCLKKGIKIYHTDITLGREIPRKSTWFEGYTDKFFFDRGVLYHYLYGRLAAIMGFRFIFKRRSSMCKDKSFGECYKLLCSGIKSCKKR